MELSKNIIINADDFGKSSAINFAIITAMELNLCKDTTLLVNFEDSEHAASLAISNSLKNNVGIHFNLTEGFPLTDKIKKERRFCNSHGLFHYKRNKRLIFLTLSEKRAVYEELTSQVQLCRNFGIPISHADSHNHIHEEPGMLPIFLNIVKNENILFLRIAKNLGSVSFINHLYRNMYNHTLWFNKLAGSNYFGSTSDFYNSKKMKKLNPIIELMIHPGLINKNQIFDIYSNENLSIQIPKILYNNKLISYKEIAYLL